MPVVLVNSHSYLATLMDSNTLDNTLILDGECLMKTFTLVVPNVTSSVISPEQFDRSNCMQIAFRTLVSTFWKLFDMIWEKLLVIQKLKGLKTSSSLAAHIPFGLYTNLRIHLLFFLKGYFFNKTLKNSIEATLLYKNNNLWIFLVTLRMFLLI